MTSPAPHRTAVRGDQSRRRGDDGFALVAAIGVAVVCLLMATTVVTVAVRSGTATGADRARTQASAAAEAGIDAAVAAIRALDPATQAAFACTPPTMPVWSSPGSSSVAVTYAFTTSPTGAPVTCPLLNGTPYAQVTITSTATHTFGAVTTRRRMTAVVPLNPAPGAAGGFDKAVFSNSAPVQAPAAGTSIRGDVYSNGPWTCPGSLSVYSGTMTAQGGYSPAPSGCPAKQSVLTSASHPAPPVVAMPALTFPAPAWPGTTTVPVSALPGVSGCTVGASTTWPSSAAIVDARSCYPLTFTGGPMSLRADVTVFAPSFSVTGNLSVYNSGSAQVFRMVVPAQSSTDVCGAGGGDITISADMSVPTVDVLLYTPGTLTMNGGFSGVNGSLYSCQSAWGGHLSLTYDGAASPPSGVRYAPAAPAKTDVALG